MRSLYVILLVIVLGFPFALRRAMVRDEGFSQQTSGAARLVVVTPHNGDIRREFGLAFDAWHRQRYGQSVTLDFRVPGGTSDLVRLLATTYATFRGPDGKLPPAVPTDLDVAW